MRVPLIYKALLSIFTLLPVVSCTTSSPGERDGIIPSGNRYATHFRIVKAAPYSTLEILNPWQGASGIIHRWYLVDRNSNNVITVPDDGIAIGVPLESIVCMSATHTAMVSALGKSDAIRGVSGAGLIFDPALTRAASMGLVKETGYDENINKELLVTLSPDLIVSYGIGGESVAYHSKLGELGLKVMYNAEYLENEPLGKAEWIRVFGALFCLEKVADSIFAAAEAEYIEIRDEAMKNTGSRPYVLLGLPWKESWYISPGNSYISRLIQDAGGKYLWEDYRSDMSMPLNLENVFLMAMKADLWLNPGTAGKLADIVATDARLASLEVLKTGRVYNNIGRTTPGGANDYWETGSVRPGLILKDIAAIINSKANNKDDSLMFYRKLH